MRTGGAWPSLGAMTGYVLATAVLSSLRADGLLTFLLLFVWALVLAIALVLPAAFAFRLAAQGRPVRSLLVSASTVFLGPVLILGVLTGFLWTRPADVLDASLYVGALLFAGAPVGIVFAFLAPVVGGLLWRGAQREPAEPMDDVVLARLGEMEPPRGP